MGFASSPGSISYRNESTWGEIATTYDTFRVPVREPVDPSGLIHNSEPSQRTEMYRQGGSPHVKMTMGGSFKTKFDWRGHGTTTAGSPSLDALETLKGIILGNVALSLAASQTCTGGTAAVPTTSAATGISAGGLVRVGALGDAAGNGQFYAVGTQSGSNMNLIGALSGAPSNGAVIYPVAMTYPSSSTGTVQPTRWLLTTWGGSYGCHGCYPMEYAVSGLDPGQRPTIDATWGVSWWEETADALPSSVASDSLNPVAVAAGSLNVQVVGTTTANIRTSARGLTVTHKINVMPQKGYGGANRYQDTTAAVRGDDDIEISWIEDAEGPATAPVVPGYWLSGSSYHLEWTGSTTAGSAIGFKCPKICPSGPKPVPFIDNGVWRVRLTAKAYTGGTTTSELTLAAIVYGDA